MDSGLTVNSQRELKSAQINYVWNIHDSVCLHLISWEAFIFVCQTKTKQILNISKHERKENMQNEDPRQKNQFKYSPRRPFFLVFSALSSGSSLLLFQSLLLTTCSIWDLRIAFKFRGKISTGTYRRQLNMREIPISPFSIALMSGRKRQSVGAMTPIMPGSSSLSVMAKLVKLYI